jgi:lysophospholipase L1-like esterase
MKKIKLTILFFFLCSILFAQEIKPAFFDEIRSFKKQDSISYPQKNAILFIGSSSFTKWTDVQEYFPGYPIINRGFGGSTLQDVIRYANDIIIPYHAKQIVIYCGENDLASSDTVTATMVFERFKKLFDIIRTNNSSVAIAFVSLKPSPSRESLWPKMVKSNELIKIFLARQINAVFIDVYHKMFYPDGTIMKDIFIEDNLHMNEKGYHIWQKIIQPYLLK